MSLLKHHLLSEVYPICPIENYIPCSSNLLYFALLNSTDYLNHDALFTYYAYYKYFFC